MASKYDQYWSSHTEQIRDAVWLAASSGIAKIRLDGLQGQGHRQSWYGAAEVRGRQVLRSSMAHATSLAMTVASDGTCAQWPGHTFRLAIDAAGDVLTVSSKMANSARTATPGLSASAPTP